ncbi:MAG: 4-hydroxy-tetrahydrodipicolinate reductase, partial [Dehalococcoidales bacterium]|nr:4-hydroxy-tetrahydrodipicolinate reductase [Dehalococcoidales bacterium]
MTIKVVVHGALGRVGQVIFNSIFNEPEIELVGAVDKFVSQDHLPLPDNNGSVPFSSDLEKILSTCKPDVLVDFSIAQATIPAVRLAAKQGVNLVKGTTGLTSDDINEIDQLTQTHKVRAVGAFNCALGAVILKHLAKIA